MITKSDKKPSIVRPGDRLLVTITLQAELDESESCHPDIMLEDFLNSRNDKSWQVEVHSVLPMKIETKRHPDPAVMDAKT